MNLPERKRIRLKDYDYSQNGAYFITICTKDRKSLLWNVGAISDRPIGLLPLSDIGKIVNNEINQLSDTYQNVSVDKSVIMPNHVHMIILICGKQGGRPEDAPTISRIIQQFKGSVSKQSGFPIWQKSFYEHIIRNEQDYFKTWKYIDTDILKWREDTYFKIEL